MRGRGWLAGLPLALALAALGLREATRPTARAAVPRFEAEPYVPPLALLAAPPASGDLAVDPGRSRARIGEVGAPGEEAQELGVEGSVRLERAGGRLFAELTFHPPGDGVSPEGILDGPLTLRGRAEGFRSTAVPGARLYALRGRWTRPGHRGDGSLELAWMQLPGGNVRLHGVLPIQDDGTTGALLPWRRRRAGLVLGFDLELAPIPRAR